MHPLWIQMCAEAAVKCPDYTINAQVTKRFPSALKLLGFDAVFALLETTVTPFQTHSHCYSQDKIEFLAKLYKTNTIF